MSLADRLRRGLAAAPGCALIAGDPGDALAGAPSPPIAAAVLLPFVDRPRPGLILTQRPDTMRLHAGQVAFPGGRVDPGDEGLVAAALREAEEEIALPRGQVEIIGSASPYRTVTGFDVTPVLGIVAPGLKLVPQPREVAAVFEVPLDHLTDPNQQRLRTVQWQGRERSFYEIVWQDRRIWGATAAMIVNLGRLLARAR